MEAERRDLLGADGPESSLVRAWIRFFEVAEQPLRVLLCPNNGVFNGLPLHIRGVAMRAHCGSSIATQAVTELRPRLRALDMHFAKTRSAGAGYLLSGESITLADVFGFCLLIDLFRLAFPPSFRSRYRSILRWFEVCLALPAFAELGGVEGVEFCEWTQAEESAFMDGVAKAFSNAPVRSLPSVPRLHMPSPPCRAPPPPPCRAPPRPAEKGASTATVSAGPALPEPPQRPVPAHRDRALHQEREQLPSLPADGTGVLNANMAPHGANNDLERLSSTHATIRPQSKPGIPDSLSVQALPRSPPPLHNRKSLWTAPWDLLGILLRLPSSFVSSFGFGLFEHVGAAFLAEYGCAEYTSPLLSRVEDGALHSESHYVKSCTASKTPPQDPWESTDPWSRSRGTPEGSKLPSRAGAKELPLPAPFLHPGDEEAAPPPPQKKEDAWVGYPQQDALAGSNEEAAAPPPPEEENVWRGYLQQGTSSAVTSSACSPSVAPPSGEDGFFERQCKCTREQYIERHIDRRFAERVVGLKLSDAELYRLGRSHFHHQEEHLQRLQASMGVREPGRPPPRDSVAYNNDGGGSLTSAGAGVARGGGGMDRVHWDEDDREESLFWWRGMTESLCFDLQLTPEDALTEGAPFASQWWDVIKLAESDEFVAVSKPAGMFVVTDQKGLWEESPTNFIHVAHQRIEMPTRYEPKQRGICHRLDSHTSGVQIFGKSWDAFRHFTVQNGTHRVQKEYLALVLGRLGGGSSNQKHAVGLVDVPLKKWQDFGRREFGSVVCAGEGMPAVTKYKALRQWRVPARGALEFWGEDRWFTLVQLRILTGRTHQIRIHMAFIGHPLVGDVKYNQSCQELDFPLVPRIFLHCMRMEFVDSKGEVFVAASDLAADLQVALGRIHDLSDQVLTEEPGMVPQARMPGFPGLAQILSRSAGARVVDVATTSHVGTAAAAPLAGLSPRGGGEEDHVALLHCCRNCHWPEEARRVTMRRGASLASFWCLRSVGPPEEEKEEEVAAEAEAAAEEEEKEADEPKLRTQPSKARRTLAFASTADAFGPGLLWIPTELQSAVEASPRVGAIVGGTTEDATAEELGEAWGAHGVAWAWAHDGSRQNGWLHLHAGGSLSTKWGPGRWKLLAAPTAPLHSSSAEKEEEEALPPPPPPLLLVTFSAVEHALRLVSAGAGSPGFYLVARRRLASGERSLAEDAGADGDGGGTAAATLIAALAALDGAVAPALTTRGWPERSGGGGINAATGGARGGAEGGAAAREMAARPE